MAIPLADGLRLPTCACDAAGLTGVWRSAGAAIRTPMEFLPAVASRRTSPAKVALTLDLWVQEIASVVTDSNGRDALTHALRQVATDREFRDPCHVWTDGRARCVTLTVDAEAQGYVPHYDGLNWAPALRCIDILQGIDLALTRPDRSPSVPLPPVSRGRTARRCAIAPG
jgi:hypothetical protein